MPKLIPCAQTHPPCPNASPVPTPRLLLLRLLLLRRLSEVAHGVCPGAAQPGWSLGLLSAEFSKPRCILALALHKPRREQKPFFPCRAAALSCPSQGRKKGRRLPSK